MASALDSRSRGLGLSPGRDIVLRDLTLTVPLLTQFYKLVSSSMLKHGSSVICIKPEKQ